MSFFVHLAKENFKFSCSHFTVLSENHAERLHGHNYEMRVTLKVSELNPDLGMAFDFNEIKPVIKSLCDLLDEKILLPQNSPYVDVGQTDGQIEVQFMDKHYSFPEDDCMILDIANVTSEELARWTAEELGKTLEQDSRVEKLKVTIQETRGQSVSFVLNL